MKMLLDILLCMCLLFSQLSPFTPVVYKLNNLDSKPVIDENAGDNTIVYIPSTEDNTEEDDKYSAKAYNFITLDMEGYCTLNIPLSHFSINEGNSTPTYKQADYNDNKTRVYMSYITNMSKSTDIPGYISNKVAKVDTVTNDKMTITYGTYDWVRIKADHQEDECNIYIYYTLSKDKTSAFWLKAKVDVNSDNDKFHDIMEQTLNTYYLYAVSGTLFETPTTGFYENYENKDGTVADTSDYEANSDKNNVFSSRGGYVLGADISDDWKDMEIILDGTKFSLPCTVQDFEKVGFELNDPTVRDDRDLDVYRTNKKTLTYKNSNGTVVSLTVVNDDANSTKKFKDCQVIALTIDAEKFIDVVLTKENEIYNEETAASNMTAANAKDRFNHELILPGGITWGVYGDDLKSYYGLCTQSNYQIGIPQYKWKSGNKQMIIRTNTVYGIKYVQIACTDVS